MTLFSDTNHANYGASLNEKRDALALDFFRAGKSLDFVLANVCGSDKKAVARAATLAKQMGVITPDQHKDVLKRFKIDEHGKAKK